MAPNKPDVEIDLLANYYDQSGDFGAPQGGLGTEELDNVAGIVVVNVPIDSNSSLLTSLGADYYSSASTDRIDYQLSTASANDLRAYGNVTWTERDLAGGRTYGLGVGGSVEYDYRSLNGKLTFAQEWDRGASELSVGLQAFFDEWDLIYPTELRPGDFIEDPGRESYGLNLSFARIINPRVQVALTAELTAMRGLLSTPFHRIYFARPDGDAFRELFLNTPLELRNNFRFVADDIERLPDTRVKVPVSLRVNWRVSDVLTLRSFSRYYQDSWEVVGVSSELELAYALTDELTVTPTFRYYDQTASEYYAGFAEHDASDEFYTSDFDLAAFSTTKVGLGVRYAPLFGLARTFVANRGLEWRSVSLRGSYYRRNPGLEAVSFTLATGFTLRRRAETKA